jgi:HAD superfamily hydrolase (TIGR01509 family)
VKLTSFKAAIFDLDGTLIRSEPAWEAAKRRVLANLGVQVPQQVYDAFVGRGLRGFLMQVLGPNLTEARRNELANQIGAEADVLLPQLRQPIAGAAETVLRLRGAGLRIAVCSSSPRRHIEAALDLLGLTGVVEQVVSGAELPRGKPDPLPYLESLRQLRLLSVDAFAVEDALPGAQSAYGAGLTVIGFGSAVVQDPAFAKLCHSTATDYDSFDRIFGHI